MSGRGALRYLCWTCIDMRGLFVHRMGESSGPRLRVSCFEPDPLLLNGMPMRQ